MTIDVNEYLDTKIKSGKFEQDWPELRNLYTRKLWHQLTLAIEKLLKNPEFAKETDLFEMYENFITDIKHRINPLALAEICIPISEQITEKDPEKAIKFLEEIKDQYTATNQNARLLFETTIGMVRLVKMADLVGARELIERVGAELESIDGIGPVHSRFYRMSSRYYQTVGKYAEYYREALRFLGCTDLNTLSEEERVHWALTISLAALMGEGIYNFGELLTHEIMDSLRNHKDYAWLVQLLEAYNRGNLTRIAELQKSPGWLKQADLVAAAAATPSMLNEKATLLGLIEAVFRRPAANRVVTFEEIAEATAQPIGKVELLVMRALSVGLVKGRIDEVKQTVSFTWLQPRVLDTEQISNMSDRLKDWCKTVTGMRELVEVDAKAILV